MLDRKDKKFISALVFMQTGILILGISLSGKFWHHQTIDVQNLNQLHELSELIKAKHKKQKTLKGCPPVEVSSEYSNQIIKETTNK